MDHKLRVAWFSELDGASATSSSMAAYFSRLIVPCLSETFDIEIFSDDCKPSGAAAPVFHYLSAFRRHEQRPYDIFFYQVEDRASCDFVRVNLATMPGVVLFHDFVFKRLGPEPILNSGWAEIVRCFRGESQDWPDPRAFHKQMTPYGWREAAHALVPLFSNAVHVSDFRRLAPAGLDPDFAKREAGYLPCPVVPFEAGPPVPNRLRVAWAARPTIEERAHKFLEALSGVGEYTLTWLIDADEQAKARELLEEFAVTDARLVIGRTPQNWESIVSDCDICVHLLFSAYGHLNPYLGISLMAGRPVLVSRFAAAELLPDQIAFKIDLGREEIPQISALLKRLAAAGEFPAAETVKNYAVETFSAKQVAQELSAVFRHAALGLDAFGRRWRTFQDSARGRLLCSALGTGSENSSDSLQDWLNNSGPFLWQNDLKAVFQELGWSDS